MIDNFFEDKTYIFRAFFGFDIFSMIHQLGKILKTPNIEMYAYNNDHIRVSNHMKAWVAFYEKWLVNYETVENIVLDFIENPYLHLKDVYDSGNERLQNHLDKCIALNTKEHVMEQVQANRIAKAFADDTENQWLQ